MKSPAAFLLALALLASACKGPSAPRLNEGPPVAVEELPESETQGPEPAEWRPPVPEDDGFIWIQMKNGEWIKGELTVLRKDSLEFESDEFGEMTLDWDDIAEFRSPNQATVRLTDGRIVVGTVAVRDDQVVMGTEEGDVQFARDDLYTILPGGPGEKGKIWSGKFTLGFTGRSGNTDQIDSSVYLLVYRRTATNRFTFTYSGVYSEVSRIVTVDNSRVDTDLRYFLNPRTYLIPISLSVLRDPFQNLDYQAIPGIGAGYQLIDRGSLEWDVNGGLGALITRYDTVEAGEDEEVSSAAVLFGTGFHQDLTKKLEVNSGLDVQFPLDERGPNLHFEIRSSLDVIKDLDFDVSFVWDRQGDPAPDANGVTPLSDDYRLTFGLSWDF